MCAVLWVCVTMEDVWGDPGAPWEGAAGGCGGGGGAKEVPRGTRMAATLPALSVSSFTSSSPAAEMPASPERTLSTLLSSQSPGSREALKFPVIVAWLDRA